jgi:hypothetical protein
LDDLNELFLVLPSLNLNDFSELFCLILNGKPADRIARKQAVLPLFEGFSKIIGKEKNE